MKYIYTLISLCILAAFSSCNDEWEDEQYVRMVSLKAPIDKEDVSSIYLRYKTNGETTFKLPVIVSGTTPNDRDINVRIGVDPDTLGILNVARYGTTRTDLYFKQLTDDFFEFPSSVCNLTSGKDVEMFDINFKFSDLNLSHKWVLPLTIQDDPSYTTNDFKGRKKALLHLNLFNDYSGIYASTSMQVYFGTETTNPTSQGTREARVVDENTIFFYAGLTEEKLLEREQYKIYASFGDITEERPDGTKIGALIVWAEKANEISFELLADPTYEVREELDKVKPYLKRRYLTVRMQYKYQDITSSPQMPIPYRCSGSMLLERKINTLVPDEDQAIEW